MTRKKLLYTLLGSLPLLLLASCADPGYYGYSGSYSSGTYSASSLTVLPHGYTRVYVGSVPYYYHGHRWYRYHSGRYIHCPRPHGYHGHLGSHRHYTSYRSPYPYYKHPSYKYSSYKHPSYKHPVHSKYSHTKHSSNHYGKHYGSGSKHHGSRYSSNSRHKHDSHTRSSRDSGSRHKSHSAPPRVSPPKSKGNSSRHGSHTVVNTGSRGSSAKPPSRPTRPVTRPTPTRPTPTASKSKPQSSRYVKGTRVRKQ